MPSRHRPLPQRILIIPLRYIGDTVLSVPLLRNLRQSLPDATLDVLTSAVSAPLLDTCPYLDQVLIEPKSISARLRLLKAGNYDCVIILRKSVTYAFLSRLAGIRQVIGYDKQRFPFGFKRWGLFLDAKTRYPSLKTEVPQAISHLGMLTCLNLPVLGDRLELWPTSTDQETVNTLLDAAGLNGKQFLAVFHAASASHGKEIDLDKFVPSLKALEAEGFAVITTGTKQDVAAYEAFKARHGLRFHNWAGATSLRETVALYQQTQILLTVDSSPIHLGAAARVPRIVGVFGPTNEKQWGPHNAEGQFFPVYLDLPCRPCYAKVCEHNNCRVQLPPEAILQMLADALAQKNKARE